MNPASEDNSGSDDLAEMLKCIIPEDKISCNILSLDEFQVQPFDDQKEDNLLQTTFVEKCSTSDSLSHIIDELDIAYPNYDYSTKETAKKQPFILDSSNCSNINSTNMPFNEDNYTNASNSRGIILSDFLYLRVIKFLSIS